MGLTIAELASKYGATVSSIPSSNGSSSINSGLQTLASKYGATISQPQAPSMFQSTKTAISNIISDPLDLKADPTKAISNAWGAIKDSVLGEGERLKTFFDSFGKTPGPSEEIGAGLKIVSGAAGVVFSPISALFAGAEQIPVLGTVAKAISLPFTAVGEVGSAVGGGIIDKLPISQTAKDQIKPGVTEIFALAGQLLLGRAIGGGKKAELETKFGIEDAKTIVDQATKLAEQKKAIEVPKVEIAKTEAPTMAEQVAQQYGAKVEVLAEQPLIQEAKKYKSAEEFVKAQTKQDYRSAHQLGLSDSMTADKIDVPALKEKIRERNGYLNNYNLSDLKRLEKLQNNPEAEVTIYRASPKNELNDGDWVTTDKTYANNIKKQNGGKVYSYTVKVGDLRFPKDTETLPSLSMASTFSYSPKTSQLTDIWNKAQEAPQSTGQVSGVAEQIKTKAIEQGFVDKGITELPDYNASTIKKQAEIGSQYSIDQLEKIARTGNLPEGMKPATPLSILEDTYKDNPEKLIEIAQSPLTARISEAASEVSLSRMREKAGVVENIREVYDTRKAEAGDALKTEVNKLKEVVKKMNPTKEAILSFIEELKCV